jgi:PPK2 family polyphosphate:nucleotide phosphotransferase
MATLRPYHEGPPAALTDELADPPPDLPAKPELEARLDELRRRLAPLHHALGAEGRRALLVVIQGRDTSGKDSVIKRVFGRLNPAYVRVAGFKRPTERELDQDFLWRIHQELPPRGMIGIFNRSHYEDVLPVRVHRLAPEPVWRARYGHINAFEQMLSDEGTVVRKFFLHISKAEQLERLEERLDDPAKNWKFDPGDLKERDRWDDYTAAYTEMLRHCSTPVAPWYVVPSNKNKPRDVMIAEVIVDTLEAMAPAFPAADPAVLALRKDLR